MLLGAEIVRLHDTVSALAAEYRAVGERHAADHDVLHLCDTLAQQCERHLAALAPVMVRDGRDAAAGDDRVLVHDIVAGIHRRVSETSGRSAQAGVLLLRDLRHLFTLACECELAWTLVAQGAKAARDKELVEQCAVSCEEVNGQVRWLKTRLKVAAPQVLAVNEPSS